METWINQNISVPTGLNRDSYKKEMTRILLLDDAKLIGTTVHLLVKEKQSGNSLCYGNLSIKL
jgi:hypothetical protein